MKVHTFIGRLIRHIPDKHFPMIRYAGLFTNRWKKKYLTMARIALNQPESDDYQEDIHPCWAKRQPEYTGKNPLICSNCVQPMVFVGSFFGNWETLQNLFNRAGRDSTIATALLRPG